MKDLLSLFNEKNTVAEEVVGNCRNHLIDSNGTIYHLIQQTNNRNSFFNAEVARHRDGLLKSLCIHYGVIPLINVIMPTHTHDVFFCDDVNKITKVIRHTNQGTAALIRKLRNKSGNYPVFNGKPGYVTIKNREQFFYLIKYLYDNPAHLKEKGEFVPYSCFDSWNNDYFKPYDKTIIEEIFEMDINTILDLCSKLGKKEFLEFSKQKFGNDSEQFSNSLFMKDISKGWLQH